jgi:GTP-binding protein HflX
VASFRSTLEEAQSAGVLVHVADLSHPHVEEQVKQTELVIKEMELDHKPVQLVFNKMDQVSASGALEKMKERYPDALFISAEKGIRLWELTERLEAMLYVGSETVTVAIPPERLAVLDEFNDRIDVRDKQWSEGRVVLTIAGPPSELKSVMAAMGNPAVVGSDGE